MGVFHSGCNTAYTETMAELSKSHKQTEFVRVVGRARVSDDRMCYHDIEAVQRRSLCYDVFKPVRQDVAGTSVFKYGPCHVKVLRIVKHGVPVEEEVTSLI